MERKLILIGFMGVGKTEIGRQLAKRLERQFIDIDHEIEQKCGMTIPEIFATKGEKTFRAIERDLSIEYITDPDSNNIISLGGGAFMQAPIREAALAHGTVIALELSWEEWLKRYDQLKDSRPLLQQRNLAEIKALYEERRHVYALNHINVCTDGLSVSEVVEKIEHKLFQR